jgi:hypothetical protein
MVHVFPPTSGDNVGGDGTSRTGSQGYVSIIPGNSGVVKEAGIEALPFSAAGILYERCFDLCS